VGWLNRLRASTLFEPEADPITVAECSQVNLCESALDFVRVLKNSRRSMRRVLSAKKRLAVMVWCGIQESPGFEAIAEILERNVSPAAATIMRAPFGLSDANELRRLVAGTILV
jgi:hypothetical protein